MRLGAKPIHGADCSGDAGMSFLKCLLVGHIAFIAMPGVGMYRRHFCGRCRQRVDTINVSDKTFTLSAKTVGTVLEHETVVACNE